MKTYTAYHFTGDTLRDGSPIPKPGIWLKHEGPIVPCRSGLHASTHPFDALQYAPGNQLHLVEVRGDVQKHGNDKIVGRERKILQSVDTEKLLWDFARWNALCVLPLWPQAPDAVVRFLRTGDESLRAAAVRHAALAVAAAAAAWGAASATVWAAASAATRAAASTAALDAALAAPRDAALAATWGAARGAAWDAARAAFMKKARRKFKQIVDQSFKQSSTN